MLAALDKAVLAISMLVCIFKCNNYDWKWGEHEPDHEVKPNMKLSPRCPRILDGKHPKHAGSPPKIKPSSSFRSQCTYLFHAQSSFVSIMDIF